MSAPGPAVFVAQLAFRREREIEKSKSSPGGAAGGDILHEVATCFAGAKI